MTETTTINKLCECEERGICKRHGVYKTDRDIELCKGVNCRIQDHQQYWEGWEAGRMPGQDNKGKECKPKKKKLNHPGLSVIPVAVKSDIGDRMKEIIEKDTEGVIPCGQCKWQIKQLNGMTPSEARENRESIIDDISRRAKKIAPKFWQRMATTIDQKLNLGETKRRVGGWLDEAIDTSSSVESE